MKLLRFALLKFEPSPEGNWQDWHLDSEGVHLQTEWAREREPGSLTLFVVARVDLPERPAVNDAGLVILPEGPLRQAETLIEISANLIAVSERCKRTITSPIPGMAFLPEDEETRAWLDNTNGILRRKGEIWNLGGFHVDPDVALELASDRPDGVALLAEALAHDHPTGMFHELLRVFERAFTLAASQLVSPLAEFLGGANMSYSEAEVNHWLTELRHPATHADKRANFVLESDVRPVMPRMVQAAYDVLFNKESWRSPSTERRDLWRPPGGPLGQSEGVFMVAGSKVKVELQLFDEAGSYPWSLDTDISGVLPPTMWWKWPSEAPETDTH